MRNHKPSPGQRPIERRSPSDRIQSLSKIEVVRRELITALTLFFRKADPVSIHVLANAANEIANKLNKAAGLESFDVTMESYIRDEYRESWKTLAVEAYNFMKHGARDPDAIYEYFNPEINKLVLLGATASYCQLAKIEPIMAVYLAWYDRYYPGIIKENAPFFQAMRLATADLPEDPDECLKQIAEAMPRLGYDCVD